MTKITSILGVKEEPKEPMAPTELSHAAPLPPVTANADPCHRQGGPHHRLVQCDLQHWSSQPAGESKPHQLVGFIFWNFPFYPQYKTPIKETKGSKIQSVHDFSKSSIHTTRQSKSNHRNWIKWYLCLLLLFIFHFSHPQSPASLFLSRSRSRSLSQFTNH